MKRLLVSFSGGETSAYMTFKILSEWRDRYDETVVAFANTGQEHENTLLFVKQCDEVLGFKTVWIETMVHSGERKGSTHRRVDFASADRSGARFEEVIRKYGISNKVSPHCTRELKERPIHHLATSIGWEKGSYDTAIGIRNDEVNRMSASAESRRLIYPLISEWPTTKEQINEHWKTQSFRLQLHAWQGNCKWCWKKSLRKHVVNLHDNPDWYDFPEIMEFLYGRTGFEFTKKTDKPYPNRVFFREERSTQDLRAVAATMPYDPPKDSNDFDPELDVGEGCADSCEVFSDDMDDTEMNLKAPTVSLLPGDNRESLRRLIDEGVRVHSVVTDPPYGLVSVVKRFGGKDAAPAKHGTDGAFARTSRGFMGQCFHPETELMTERGWRKVTEIAIGETVATMDPMTRDLEWQPVVETHRYAFEGSLVHIKHRSSEQVITPNHRMLVSHDRGLSLELLEPSKLKRAFHMFAQAKPMPGKKDRVVITSQRDYGKDLGEIREETRNYDPEAFFKFFGLWLGDGYTVSRRDDHPANDFCGLNVTKERKKNAIRDCLTGLGVKFKETPHEDGKTAFYIYDFGLLHWLKQFGKARDKFIPSEFFEWDHSYLEHLYRGLIETDGCVQGRGQEVFFTSSRRLADDFQRLCLHVGRSASLCHNPGGKTHSIGASEVTANESWVCCVLQPGKRMYGEKSTRSSNVVFDFPYAGEVFCVGVPKHHTLYTRFNGKPVWTGNSWDGTGIERDPEFWKLIYDILLPGGFVFAFSGSRTGHWQACAMETAGFVMHPMHGWAYGSGFPKAHDAAKAIDKMLGAEGGFVPEGNPIKRLIPGADQYATGNWIKDNGREYQPGEYQPGSPEAQAWDGWAYGTQSQKPALEPIYLGQKPFSEKTGAANLLKHGVGAFNIDGCRVPAPGETICNHGRNQNSEGSFGPRLNPTQEKGQSPGQALGRWPANLILDGSPEVVDLFPESSVTGKRSEQSRSAIVDGTNWLPNNHESTEYTDSGSAARFFHNFPPDLDPIIYQAKAGKADRAGSAHPTVKPIALMQYLIRHITPPGGTVLDPFAGSGTTGEAAKREGFDCILMEAKPDYVEFLNSRFELHREVDDSQLVDTEEEKEIMDWLLSQI